MTQKRLIDRSDLVEEVFDFAGKPGEELGFVSLWDSGPGGIHPGNRVSRHGRDESTERVGDEAPSTKDNPGRGGRGYPPKWLVVGGTGVVPFGKKDSTGNLRPTQLL
jgi:hypothetical protein